MTKREKESQYITGDQVKTIDKKLLFEGDVKF